MATSGTPSWLADEERGDKQPLKGQAFSSSSSSSSGYVPPPMPGQSIPMQSNNTNNNLSPISPSLIHFLLRATCMFLCMLMFFTALYGLSMISSVGSSERIFVASYMLFFSALLFFFELNQLRPIEYVDHMYRRNFGFLYGALTKSLFIIFIAFLSFGLEQPETLTMSTGVLMAAFGALGVGLYLKYPDMFEPQNPQQ